MCNLPSAYYINYEPVTYEKHKTFRRMWESFKLKMLYGTQLMTRKTQRTTRKTQENKLLTNYKSSLKPEIQG